MSTSIHSQALLSANPAEQRRLVSFGTGPRIERPYPLLHQAFEAQARLRPFARAVEHQGEVLRYGELDRQSNRVAAELVRAGVRPGDRVGLFLQRSIPMVVGMLGTLKAGAAYVPQHLGVAPAAQLRHVVEVAEIDVVLTLSSLCHHLPHIPGVTVLCVDELSEGRRDHEDTALDIAPVSSTSPCFILFTSGTTGMPNGVRVTHRNVCNIVHTSPGNLEIRPGMRVSQLLSIAFDMSAWEVWSALSHGATLVIRGRSIEECAQQVDVIIATPSVLASIDPETCTRVKTVAVAGEPCSRELAESWAAHCTFYNSCGPTETTIVNTMQRFDPTDGKLTIGRPTPNNTVYILDEQRRPCPLGEVGEMWAGGDCVTAGYIANDLLNRERYRPDPFRGRGLMFRTRDLGRWTEDGKLEHHGRTDDQVKVRGFRVELDSVSRVIEELPSCQRAVTMKLDDRHLVSFVAPEMLSPEQVQEAVGQMLPYYCIPKLVVGLESFPSTARGKVDKRALRELLASIREGVQ